MDKPHLHVEFFTDTNENPVKSQAAGRPIFDQKEMVRIRFVGDNKNVLVAPANQGSIQDKATGRRLTYIDRFPEHYAAFKRGQTDYIGDGTPLSELPFLTEAKRKELQALNIHTAESLAQLDGAPLQRLGMGGRELKNKAQAYMDRANGSAGVTKLASENAALKEQLENMQAQMNALAAKVSAAPVAAPVVEDDVSGSQFNDWADDDMKAFIKDAKGQGVRGQPSHATLVRMCDEIVAENAKVEEAA